MNFVDRLRPELIAIAPGWRTFSATVEGLAALLAAHGALATESRAAATRAVAAREAQSPTTILDIGVGIPHARLGEVDQETVALALDPDGLYEAVPTVPIHIVALVLSPPSAVDEHLRILASIATRLRSPELRAALIGAVDPVAAYRVLVEHARAR